MSTMLKQNKNGVKVLKDLHVKCAIDNTSICSFGLGKNITNFFINETIENNKNYDFKNQIGV
jgi:hypothetical protein